MAMEFIVPSVQIDESDVGTRPTDQMSLAGIGIVGTFERGPVNFATTIGDEDQLVNTFGSYVKGLTGYLSAIGALRQGANDLRIVRIVGAGAKKASVSLMQSDTAYLTVEATSEGAWGNEIKVEVAKEADAATFDLTITFRNSVEKFRELTLEKIADIVPKYVTLTLAENASGLPDATEAAKSLTGGSDGAEVDDDDYIGAIDSSTGDRTGLKVLEPVQCGIVLCAQQTSDKVRSALLTFCKNCDIEEGLRIAILNTQDKLSVDSAIAQTKTLDSDRGVFAFPWVEPEELEGEYVAPDGYLAGVISVLNPHQSPSNKQVNGILSTRGDYTYAQVKVLTEARICPITLVPNRGFRVRNGLTLSSDSAWSQICIRRQQDKMNMELWNAMQWAISEPHDTPLWNNIAAQCDAYLQVQKNLGYIRGYKKTLCNSQTNPPENIQARILTAVIRWLPLYPADFIVLRMKRELSEDDAA